MKMKDKLTAANGLTCIRLAGGVSLIFIEPFSMTFFIIYSLCGVTDALDGFVARRSKTAGEFGAKLDSIADLFFYGVLFFRILPVLLQRLTFKLWVWLISIFVLRFSAYIAAAAKFRRFASLHTWLNKATGLIVFGVPYVIMTEAFPVYAIIGETVATLSSGEELLIHLLSPHFSARCKSIFSLRRVTASKE